jgi:hypothetical protein
MESLPNTRSGIQMWKRSNVIARAQNTLEEIHEFADQKKINVSVSVLDSIIESVVWQTLGFDKRIAAANQR